MSENDGARPVLNPELEAIKQREAQARAALLRGDDRVEVGPFTMDQLRLNYVLADRNGHLWVDDGPGMLRRLYSEQEKALRDMLASGVGAVRDGRRVDLRPYPGPMNGDRAEFEAEWAASGRPDHERPDWPLPSFDAQDWAKAFAEVADRLGIGASNGDKGLDIGWLTGWFANALMRGYDEAMARRGSEQLPGKSGQFRKRPVVVDAFRMTLEQFHAPQSGWPEWMVKALDAKILGFFDRAGRRHFDILTPEGTMTVTPGDWIIRGVAGELYPCKPDIFEATYEAVT